MARTRDPESPRCSETVVRGERSAVMRHVAALGESWICEKRLVRPARGHSEAWAGIIIRFRLNLHRAVRVMTDARTVMPRFRFG